MKQAGPNEPQCLFTCALGQGIATLGNARRDREGGKLDLFSFPMNPFSSPGVFSLTSSDSIPHLHLLWSQSALLTLVKPHTFFGGRERCFTLVYGEETIARQWAKGAELGSEFTVPDSHSQVL